jgi:hypothetical protein
MVPLGDYRHELNSESTSLPFGSQMREWGGRTANEACRSGTYHRPFNRGTFRTVTDLEVHALCDRIRNRPDPSFLALPLAEPEAVYQGHPRLARWIWAGNSASPQPRDDVRSHAIRKNGVGVEAADTTLCLIAHPSSVEAHIISQTLRTAPRPGARQSCPVVGMDGSLASEFRRQFNEGLGDEHGNRVEIARVRFGRVSSLV